MILYNKIIMMKKKSRSIWYENISEKKLRIDFLNEPILMNIRIVRTTFIRLASKVIIHNLKMEALNYITNASVGS